MAKKETKTNALRILDALHVNYEIHSYEVDDHLIDGVSVAKKCGQDPEKVFKTLVTVGADKQHYVFVIPVGEKLDLKAAAVAAGVKNIEMIHQKELLPLTGYIHGGCSPVGMKKTFPTFFDETIILFDKICVSAGRVGLQMEVAVEDLISVTEGTVTAITVQ